MARAVTEMDSCAHGLVSDRQKRIDQEAESALSMEQALGAIDAEIGRSEAADSPIELEKMSLWTAEEATEVPPLPSSCSHTRVNPPVHTRIACTAASAVLRVGR